MKRIISIMLLAGLTLAAVFSQTTEIKRSEQNARQVRQFESDWIAADLNGDRDWLKRFDNGKLLAVPTDEEFKNRTRQLSEMIESAVANNPARAADIKVRVTGNISVFGGSESESGGNMVSGNRSYNFLDTFNKRGGKWQIIATHFSRVSDATGENSEQTLTRLERELNAAIARKDAAKFQRLAADDFNGIESRGGIFNKSQTINGFETGGNDVEPAIPADLKIKIYGDAATVTGYLLMSDNGKEENGSRKLAFTDVWIKRNDQWQIVNRQTAGVL
ncbi:MAG: nuclear transport factor 2 family protein [Pyrinomonadaceae bacterium]